MKRHDCSDVFFSMAAGGPRFVTRLLVHGCSSAGGWPRCVTRLLVHGCSWAGWGPPGVPKRILIRVDTQVCAWALGLFHWWPRPSVPGVLQNPVAEPKRIVLRTIF